MLYNISLGWIKNFMKGKIHLEIDYKERQKYITSKGKYLYIRIVRPRILRQECCTFILEFYRVIVIYC